MTEQQDKVEAIELDEAERYQGPSLDDLMRARTAGDAAAMAADRLRKGNGFVSSR